MHIAFVIITIIGLCASISSPATAGEDPDELYLAGKFADAEKEYARLDMDDPKEIRHRYNRGCAAFQSGDFQSAAAAFSSVLQRSKDPEIGFKAAYNLANTAFHQGDMKSAAALYGQAIRLKPESQDARYNLELSLRELERLKSQEQESPEKQPEDRQGEQERSPEKENQAQGDPQEGDRQEGEQASEQESDSGQHEPKTDGSEEEQKKPREERAESAGKGDEGTQQPESLDGELSPIRPMEQQGPAEPESGEAASAMDRKRAEALLDNMQEDRSRFLRFQMPADRKGGVRSGKDW